SGSGGLLEELKRRQDLLHGREMRIACADFDVVLDPEGCDHGIREGDRYAARVKSSQVCPGNVPERFGNWHLLESAKKNRSARLRQPESWQVILGVFQVV